jgi:hypothetical protein
VLDEDARHARLEDGQAKVWSFPSMLSKTAYVRPYNAHDHTAATVVHFHIPYFEPSAYAPHMHDPTGALSLLSSSARECNTPCS